MSASATQLRLVPGARPLDERLGAGFFRQLPRQPGVYRMFGADGTLLYVGKAGDLRQRLNSYRSLTHASCKEVRLVHAVHAITWEVCASEEAASLLENALLRTHRPRFNRVGVWPQANGYLELIRSGEDLRLRFVRSPAGQAVAESERYIGGLDLGLDDGGTVADRRLFGAFKPGARLACGALARLLWGHREDWPDPAQLPRSLLSTVGAPAHWLSQVGQRTADLLAVFLSGQSAELLNLWVGFAEVPGSPFLWEFWRRDWELAAAFYHTGPARNCTLRERFGGGDTLLGESELDDLLVRWRRDGPRPG